MPADASASGPNSEGPEYASSVESRSTSFVSIAAKYLNSLGIAAALDFEAGGSMS